jgi:hypothetical protein
VDLEEIVDDATAPTRASVLFWVTLTVIGVVVGSVLVAHRTSTPPETTAVVATSEAAKPIPLPSVPEIIGLGQNLALGYTCPAVTVGGATLAISFQVVNFGEQDVTLLSVTPDLAHSGLRTAGNPTMGGACSEPGNDAPGGLISPGDSRLITLRFTRPASCTGTGKGQALDVSARQMVGTTTKALKSDLGLVHFIGCSS